MEDRMGSPIQMTAKLLSAKKGWPSPHAVDFATTFDASITSYVPPGAVVHLSAILTFVLGVGNLFVMPMFTLWASDSFDVQNYGGNPATDKGVWAPIVRVGTDNALVASVPTSWSTRTTTQRKRTTRMIR